MALEKAHTAVHPAEVCAKSWPREYIRELCRFSCVFLCHSEDAAGADPEEWCLSQLNERSSGAAHSDCCRFDVTTHASLLETACIEVLAKSE